MKKLLLFLTGAIFIYLGAVTFSGNTLMWVFLGFGALLILSALVGKKPGNGGNNSPG